MMLDHKSHDPTHLTLRLRSRPFIMTLWLPLAGPVLKPAAYWCSLANDCSLWNQFESFSSLSDRKDHDMQSRGSESAMALRFSSAQSGSLFKNFVRQCSLRVCWFKPREIFKDSHLLLICPHALSFINQTLLCLPLWLESLVKRVSVRSRVTSLFECCRGFNFTTCSGDHSVISHFICIITFLVVRKVDLSKNFLTDESFSSFFISTTLNPAALWGRLMSWITLLLWC